MKTLSLLICLSLVSGFAFSKWTWQNPLPTTNNLILVFFPDANTGYAVGENGRIMKTTDGGLKWDIQYFPSVPRIFNSVFFEDQFKDLIAGDTGTIFKTTDYSNSLFSLFRLKKECLILNQKIQLLNINELTGKYADFEAISVNNIF